MVRRLSYWEYPWMHAAPLADVIVLLCSRSNPRLSCSKRARTRARASHSCSATSMPAWRWLTLSERRWGRGAWTNSFTTTGCVCLHQLLRAWAADRITDAAVDDRAVPGLQGQIGADSRSRFPNFSQGQVTISNDGATIMRLLEIVHPAAKSLVDVSLAQDAEARSSLAGSNSLFTMIASCHAM